MDSYTYGDYCWQVLKQSLAMGSAGGVGGAFIGTSLVNSGDDKKDAETALRYGAVGASAGAVLGALLEISRQRKKNLQ